MESNLIRLSKSCIGKSEKEAVNNVLDREYLGMGEDVKEFERLLHEFFGRPAVCVSSGTAALHLALQASGLARGDQVLVPSLTYVATFQAISASGAQPISCEINEKDCLLDYRLLEKNISSKTKAIMPVHYAGDPGKLDQLYKVAKRHNLLVIEDAAHAFGSNFQDKRIGSFGDIACFSFDGIKNITSGEGGCIVSDDLRFIDKVKDLRLLGVINDSEKRFKGERSWDFDSIHQGWRYHMSNIMAAIGI